MATRDDSERSREEGDEQIMDIALQAAHKVAGKGSWGAGEGRSWNALKHTGDNDAHRGGKSSWQKDSGTKGGKGQDRGGKGDNRTC